MKWAPLISSLVLIGVVAGGTVALAAWKRADIASSMAEAASMPEPAEFITTATVVEKEHRSMTTAVGSVLALRSVTLRNELAGTVVKTELTPGKIVEEGAVLVSLDVSVEEAELKALEAQLLLAEATYKRMESLVAKNAAPGLELDRARSERDVMLAQIARNRALIAKKTLRAPFRARLGLSDLHAGQYLAEGTELTSLQGVDATTQVDFTVTQNVAAGLKEGDVVQVLAFPGRPALAATIVAIDARVNVHSRSATVRARIEDATQAPPPGSSVKVQVPVGEVRKFLAIPVNSLRRGPEGDHVFVIAPGQDGKLRSQLRLVKAGRVAGDEVLLEDGVTAGEKIAASGSFKLREGALVIEAPAAPAGK